MFSFESRYIKRENIHYTSFWLDLNLNKNMQMINSFYLLMFTILIVCIVVFLTEKRSNFPHLYSGDDRNYRSVNKDKCLTRVTRVSTESRHPGTNKMFLKKRK